MNTPASTGQKPVPFWSCQQPVNRSAWHIPIAV